MVAFGSFEWLWTFTDESLSSVIVRLEHCATSSIYLYSAELTDDSHFVYSKAKRADNRYYKRVELMYD